MHIIYARVSFKQFEINIFYAEFFWRFELRVVCARVSFKRLTYTSFDHDFKLLKMHVLHVRVSFTGSARVTWAQFEVHTCYARILFK